ncbi:Pls/PosA family non-ribosomal peptide synthetase [Cellulomonas humilata]|uniref:Non-ribosomal peptide synthetase-like protein n=1 Tax=Cellulomonas humilata TaxID=144055 RepID=A0ABU0EG41_9CELL|nr:Pls/PosA family non-ribosomal peptide synthetase [Cellulomonas humilata]MDQ0374240.1 non-ribosomal peptide synthetase-like protein [Cellulomonas humilata]
MAAEGFLRSDLAPAARTLVDVLEATALAHGDAPAIDDGSTVLTYGELLVAVRAAAAGLAGAGIGPGDRVGVRIPSGTAELYTAILAVLAAGAAYVPVDVDDPDERAQTVFREAGVALVLTEGDLAGLRRTAEPRRPALDDDAWIIFTSGSTGAPKGVAVTHRSAAAFVDAEARLFLQQAPLGPGDRVLAGLSVAFDASCEEMWLAWGHGACLVPAPRALVRTGMDLGPWLVAQGITVISTVPTLAGLWRAEELAGVRLLIFGGEACPPELVARLVGDRREVWNTYGPTEATVVACAALLTGDGPVRIGHALDGWDLAVVAPDGSPVDAGGLGELIIGGVGLARYLDPAKDAEKYAPADGLGWERAYRSGDLVRYEPEGLVFVGRADDQVKVGGRRIELGEVDSALLGLPGVAGAAAAVRRTPAGTSVLVGYLVPEPGVELDLADARHRLTGSLPAALVPLLAPVDSIPTRGSGKVDRDALPWPLARPDEESAPAVGLTPTGEWVAERWTAALGVAVAGPRDDFFASGGGSLVAAQLVSALRARFPTVTVADVYEYPRIGDLARRLDEFEPTVVAEARVVTPTPVRAQLVQTVLALPLAALVGLRWLTWLLAADAVLVATTGAPWVPVVPGVWWWVALGWLVLISPLGRMGTTVLVARTLLRGLTPGRYPRGGSTHLRLWFTESWAAAAGAENLSCSPWTVQYARALGATIGRDVDLHALPPVTGLLTLGNGCAVEPEVDLRGHWLDGDVLRVGRVRIDKRATVGTRSTLAPGTRVGAWAEVAPGSAVLDSVPPGELWVGSPAVFDGPSRRHWPRDKAPRGGRWVAAYGATAAALAALPVVAAACGLLVVGVGLRDASTWSEAFADALRAVPLGAVTTGVVLVVVTLVSVRLLGLGFREGYHAVRSRAGWQVWATLRLMDDARTTLFPLYSSLATPVWLRALGADIGKDVEASTALMLPTLTTVGDGAFLADDTLIGSYELGHGWLRVERSKVGKRAFLGNSGMIAPGRAVPKRGLVAVLSATPEVARAGTSWLGSPPVKLRRVAGESDDARTFAPPMRLRVARALVELCRIVPVICTFGLGVVVLLVLQAALDAWGLGTAAALSPLVVLAAAGVACALATAAKWLLVGRLRPGDHPLWSSFIWRNELADTFLEVVAVPWLGPATNGSPALTVWLRTLGARIGRGVWCETYWLPEADLVTLGDAATVNRGCVLQTHLFHDRVMSMDTVELGRGASLGPHGVVLPAASLDDGARVGPASLVLRGDTIPAGSRWTGNPVSPA